MEDSEPKARAKILVFLVKKYSVFIIYIAAADLIRRAYSMNAVDKVYCHKFVAKNHRFPMEKSVK